MSLQTNSDRIFTKTFLALATINFLIMIAFYMLFVITGPYAQQQFAVAPSMGGLVAGGMVVGTFIGRFWAGHLVNLIGAKYGLLLGLAVYCVALAGYVPANSLGFFFLMRLISGIGVGFVNTVTGTVIAYILPEHKRGAGISYFSLSTVLTMALGPFLGVFLQQVTSFQVMFLLCLASGMIGLLLAFFLTLHEAPTTSKGHVASSLSLNSYLDSRVALFSLFILVAAAAYASVQTFMSEYARSLDLLDAASVFFLVYAATVFVTRLYTGKIYDMHGEHRIIYPALIALTLGLFTLSHAEGLALMLVSGVLTGAGFGNIVPVAQAASLKLVPRHRFAQATSTFYVILDCGLGFGPYFFGLLAPMIGYQGIFSVAAGASLLSLFIYHALHGRKRI